MSVPHSHLIYGELSAFGQLFFLAKHEACGELWHFSSTVTRVCKVSLDSLSLLMYVLYENIDTVTNVEVSINCNIDEFSVVHVPV